MNAEELINTIEGHEFAAELNAASDWNTFRWAMHNHPAVRTLASLLGSTTGKESVLRRVGSLSNREVDPRYENVSDVALTVYVSLLASHDATLGRLAAVAAARASRCWWTTLLANRLLSLGPSSPAVGDTFAIAGSAPIVRSPHLEVADTLIWPDLLHDDPISHLLSNPFIRSSKGQDSPANRIALAKSPWASLRTEAVASETSN